MALRLAEHAMGTRFELVLPGAETPALRAIGEEALREVVRWHHELSAFERSSTVSRLNDAAGTETWVRVGPEVVSLLELCRDVWTASGGAFDPTIGAAMRRLGFHPGGDEPGQEERAGFDGVEIDAAAGAARLTRPGLRLDLGAIGKGWALDRAADILREHGVAHALLHGGTSSVVALGDGPPGEGPWRIALCGEGPDAPTIELRGMSLGVSAPRGRAASLDGRTTGHILDPRTGRPSTGVPTAAVVGSNCALCDAWSTALVVLGSRPGTMPGAYTSLMEGVDRTWAIDGPAARSIARRNEEVRAA